MSEKSVVAKSGLTALPPWLLRESKRHEGRWYFYNTDTKESAWSLPQSMVRRIEANSCEPNDAPPDVVNVLPAQGSKLPVLSVTGTSPDPSPTNGPQDPIIPTISGSINGAWGGGSDGSVGGRYRRASIGASSSLRSSVGSSTSESDKDPMSPLSAPVDSFHHPMSMIGVRFEGKAPPQLNSPLESPLFHRNTQNRGGISPNAQGQAQRGSLTPPAGGKTLSPGPLSRTDQGRSNSTHSLSTPPLHSRTGYGRSISTQSLSTSPRLGLSPHSSQRKLINDVKPLESPQLSPRTISSPGPPFTTPPINPKILLKSKSTDNFRDSDGRGPRKMSPAQGSLLVNDHSERLRLLSMHCDSVRQFTLEMINENTFTCHSLRKYIQLYSTESFFFFLLYMFNHF